MLSIGTMFRMPAVVPVTSSAGVPSRLSSAVGSLRVPSLSLRRLMRMLRSRPSSSRQST